MHAAVECIPCNMYILLFGVLMDHFVNAPSQYDTMLQCNIVYIVSHWLGASTKWSLCALFSCNSVTFIHGIHLPISFNNILQVSEWLSLTAFLREQTMRSMCSVLPKVFWAPVLRTSGSWNLPVRMEGSLVRNFNNYYVLLIHVFDGCSNRFHPCDH